MSTDVSGTNDSDAGRPAANGGTGPFDRVCLTVQFNSVAQVDEFFRHTPRWQIDRLILMPLDWSQAAPQPPFWRGMHPRDMRHWPSYPFGAATPALGAHRVASEVQAQLDISDAVYRHCQAQGIELVAVVHVPKFAYNKPEQVRQALPELFRADGTFNLEAPAYLPYLEMVLDEWRARYPQLAGFEIRVSEGGTATVHHYSLQDLETLDRWLPPIVALLEAYGRRHGVVMEVYAHHYNASRGTRRNLHDLLGRHPSLWILEDLTWPEEHVALPYLGYLGEEWSRLLAASNPLCLIYQVDTEYMGGGLLPTVFPGWLQGGLRYARNCGARGVTGRVLRWDNFRTLENWNLLNADMFCALARDPDQDPRPLLKDAVSRRFGAAVAADLTDLLLHSERLVRLQAINGIDFTNHGAFPLPKHLHRAYMGTPLAMKAVDDLFSPPGTRLYGEVTDDLTADKEWRQQLRVVAQDPSVYLRVKDTLIAEISRLCDEADRVADALPEQDGSFVRTSYRLWLTHARALRLFTEAAATHARWVAGGCQEGTAARELAALGTPMEELAERCDKDFGENVLFDFADRLRTMAQFLREPPPIE